MKKVIIVCLLGCIFLRHLGSLQYNAMTDSKNQIDFQRKVLLLAGEAFHESFGRYPQGDVGEILRQLGGANPTNTKFIDLTLIPMDDSSVDGDSLIILGGRLRFKSDGQTFHISLDR